MIWIRDIHAFGKKCYWFNSIFLSDSCRVKNKSLEQSFPIVSKFEIISAVLYERKNIICCEKNFKLTKSIAFDKIFCNRLFPFYRFLPIFLKLLDFHKSWLIISGKILSTTLLFLILKISKKSSNIVLWKNSFSDFSHWKLYFENKKQYRCREYFP